MRCLDVVLYPWKVFHHLVLSLLATFSFILMLLTFSFPELLIGCNLLPHFLSLNFHPLFLNLFAKLLIIVFRHVTLLLRSWTFFIYILIWLFYIVIDSFEDDNSEFFHITVFFISVVDELWYCESVLVCCYLIFLYFYASFGTYVGMVYFPMLIFTFFQWCLFCLYKSSWWVSSFGIMFPSVIFIEYLAAVPAMIFFHCRFHL